MGTRLNGGDAYGYIYLLLVGSMGPVSSRGNDPLLQRDIVGNTHRRGRANPD